MARFERGVSYYTTGVINLPVHFPEDAVACRYCRYSHMDNMERMWCRLTGALLYSKDAIPEDCPIEFEKEEKK